MNAPLVTACYAALFGLLFMALSAWVIAGRGKYKVMNNDGGVEALSRRIRAHANFAEYVPLILLLVTFLEVAGAGRITLHLLLGALLLGRIAHPFGMAAADNSLTQKLGRGLGTLATFAVLIITSIMLLARLL